MGDGVDVINIYMNRDEVRAAVQRVFAEVFADDEDFEFSEHLDRDSFKAWDSLGHVRLIGALEEAFGERFTIPEIESFTSAGRIIERLSTGT
jgi:acyl carrier protein